MTTFSEGWSSQTFTRLDVYHDEYLRDLTVFLVTLVVPFTFGVGTQNNTTVSSMTKVLAVASSTGCSEKLQLRNMGFYLMRSLLEFVNSTIVLPFRPLLCLFARSLGFVIGRVRSFVRFV